MIDLLRQYTPGFLNRHGNQAPPQVQDTLAKLAMCRTLALGEHVYECPRCQHRSQDKDRGNPSKPYTLTGVEFTRRWALYILPKRFVKSRCFGGFSCRQREAYRARCRTLLGGEQAPPASSETPAAEPAEAEPAARLCPRCQTPMNGLSQDERVSWRSVVNGPHGPAWYSPLRHAIQWGCLHWFRDPPDG